MRFMKFMLVTAFVFISLNMHVFGKGTVVKFGVQKLMDGRECFIFQGYCLDLIGY